MEDLKERLNLHKAWLFDNTLGKKLQLSGAILRRADLSGANLSGAYLRRTDLSGANLRRANLSGVDLSGADLSGAKLSGVDLSSADLSGANLSGADLSGANLSGADLSGANFRRAIGNGKELKSLQIGIYLVCYTKDILNIGCQSHNYSEWRTFSDSIILDMDGQIALDWWNLNKHIIFELIDREDKQ